MKQLFKIHFEFSSEKKCLGENSLRSIFSLPVFNYDLRTLSTVAEHKGNENIATMNVLAKHFNQISQNFSAFH